MGIVWTASRSDGRAEWRGRQSALNDMQYGRTIAIYLPLMIAAAVGSAFFVSLLQALVGYTLGILAGVVIAQRGVRVLKSHILQRNREGFRLMPRAIGIFIFFILPFIAGITLGLLYQFQPGLVMTAVVAGSSGVATWWLLMGCWVWYIEHRSGREIFLSIDGFYLSPRKAP